MFIARNSNAAADFSASPPTKLSADLCLYRIIEQQAARTPDGIAFTAPGREPLTYSGLRSRVEQTVGRLNSFGIERNDCVAMVLPDGSESAVGYIGVAAGFACAPLNPRYRVSEFDFYLRRLNPKAVIVQSGIGSPILEVAQAHNLVIIELVPALEAQAGTFALSGTKRAYATHDGFAQGDDVALILPTSGTTSRSKLVPLTQVNICAAAAKVQAALELTTDDRYLNVTPLFYSQGIMLTIASICAGASVVCPAGFSAAHFLRWLGEFQPTWYSAAPTIHQAILTHARNTRAIMLPPHSLRFIRSAAAPLPSRTRAALEKVFRAPVIESYGMTECYPISSNPLPPGTRKPGSAGVAAGTEIAVIDADGRFLCQGETGEIVVAGSQVMRGYLNEPDGDRAFVNGWLRTGDQGYIDADGHLFVTGRIKEIINRGGEKLSPHEVDGVLLEHWAISEAVTFPVSHPTLGEDVAAAVVLRDEAKVTERELQSFVATHLAQFKVPRQVLFVKQIPKTATGKIQRIGLAENLGVAGIGWSADAGSASRVSEKNVEAKLVKIWASILGLGTSMVTNHDNFFELGGNSLLSIQLIAQVQRIFGKHLTAAALFQAPTIEQLATLIRQDQLSPFESSLVPITAAGAMPPFFWIHGDSGASLLAEFLGNEQPFYALDHQAQNGKPARYTQVETIAAYYVEEIRRIQFSGPFYLGGFSFGGMVAFEMAQQLVRKGEDVALLFLLDSHFAGADIPDVPAGLKNTIFSRVTLERHHGNLSRLRAQEKLAYIWTRACSNARDAINRTKLSQVTTKAACRISFLLGRSLPVSLRSRYIMSIYHTARQLYRPQIYSGRRTIYIKSKKRSEYHRLEWSKLVARGLELYEVPGDHLDLIEAPYFQFWAGRLKAALRAAQGTDKDKQVLAFSGADSQS